MEEKKTTSKFVPHITTLDRSFQYFIYLTHQIDQKKKEINELRKQIDPIRPAIHKQLLDSEGRKKKFSIDVNSPDDVHQFGTTMVGICLYRRSRGQVFNNKTFSSALKLQCIPLLNRYFNGISQDMAEEFSETLSKLVWESREITQKLEIRPMMKPDESKKNAKKRKPDEPNGLIKAEPSTLQPSSATPIEDIEDISGDEEEGDDF